MIADVKLKARTPAKTYLKTKEADPVVFAMDEGANGGGTLNYNYLYNKPSINSIELVGNKTTDELGLQSKITAATKTDIDRVISGTYWLANANVIDVEALAYYDQQKSDYYVTEAEITAVNRRLDALSIPTKTSDITNDSGFITRAAIPSNISQFVNDAGYATVAALPTKYSDLIDDKGYITQAAIPSKVSQLDNDAGYLTSAVLPTRLSQLEDDINVALYADLPTAITEDEIDDIMSK